MKLSITIIVLLLLICLLLLSLILRQQSKESFQNNQQSFTEIIKKYESDNLVNGTDKSTDHTYNLVYEQIFLPYRNKEINILEIGLYSGADLLAFDDYFDNANIYGIDITDKNLIPELKTKFNIYIGDATIDSTINYFGQQYDIIIEDASHMKEHQIKHFIDYSKFLKQDGIYVIEDISSANYDELTQTFKQLAIEKGLSFEIYDNRTLKNRHDDILFVFKRY